MDNNNEEPFVRVKSIAKASRSRFGLKVADIEDEQGRAAKVVVTTSNVRPVSQVEKSL